MTTDSKHWMRGVKRGQVFLSECLMVWLSMQRSVAYGLIQKSWMAPNFSLVSMPADVPVASTLVFSFVVGELLPWH